jgi:hypothetical protein
VIALDVQGLANRRAGLRDISVWCEVARFLVS